MDENRQQGRILAAAVLLYSAILIGLALWSYRANDRHIVYSLDDAYIHLAMSKNLVEHGIFGITPYEFSSSSSSPLWTLLLAGLGASEWLPLLLNYVFGATAIVIIWKFGLDAGLKGLRLGLLLAASILLTPIIPLAFTGMEHLLHLCAVLFLAYSLWRVLRHVGPIGWDLLWLFGASTALAAAVRYETLFLVVAACLVLAARRQWVAVAVCGVCALVPISAFGAFLVANGQFFLPNTLLLKGNIPELHGLTGIVKALGYEGVLQLMANPHLYILATCLVALFWWEHAYGRRPDATNLLLIVVLSAMALHLQFAKTGWFYRYEAYLVTLAIVALSIRCGTLSNTRGVRPFRQQSWSSKVSFVALMSVLLLPLVQRATAAHFKTVQATRNIYQQQYQMGRFLHRYYEGQPVAANDVGAVNYLARIRCLDLWGLGSREILRHKIDGSYTTTVIRDQVREHGVHVVVVYTSWFQGKSSLPDEWVLAGTWTIPNNVVCGSDTVSFFAIEPSDAGRLLAQLRLFSAELPKGVVWNERAPGTTVGLGH